MRLFWRIMSQPVFKEQVVLLLLLIFFGGYYQEVEIMKETKTA